MKRFTKLAAALTTAVMLSAYVPARAQTATETTPHKKTKRVEKKKETATEVQLREMKEQLAAQQSQIDSLKGQVASKDQQAATAQQSAADAQTQAAAAAAAAAQASSAAAAASAKADEASSSVNDVKANDVTLQETVIATQAKLQEDINSPSSLHYKGITITPVAFFAFENVYRERAMNSDVNTPFNSIPFPGANEGHVNEINFSGRQSRIGALFQGDAGAFKLSGYVEADFLGSGTTSNGNQSNSYALRQRQIWGQAAMANGFTVTGGQMWSLVTETGKGADNRTEKLPNSVDAQYVVGFSWTRQAAIRFQQRFGDYKTGAFTLAMSLENAQITNFTATSATSGAVPTNFFFAGSGQNGGLYNTTATYADNVSPDVVVKGVYDLPKAHFELGGIARFLRDYYYPITSYTGTSTAPTYVYSTNYTSDTKAAGGVFGSVRVSPSKFVDVAAQAMAGTGVGRYGTSQLADATIRPDGTLEPIRNYHGMFSLETHPAPKLDVYAYYGGEYAQRTVYTTPQGDFIGYGAKNLVNTACYATPSNPASSTGGVDTIASNCASPTRYIQEGLIGATYRFVNSPKYGRLQYAVNYQYVQRNLWSGVGNATTPSGPRALNNMVLTSLRYYIP